MSSVLIRDVPDDVLHAIRQAAAAEGSSLQGYLLRALSAQARYVRRQEALAAVGRDLEGRPAWTAQDHAAALDAADDGADERGAHLAQRREP